MATVDPQWLQLPLKQCNALNNNPTQYPNTVHSQIYDENAFLDGVLNTGFSGRQQVTFFQSQPHADGEPEEETWSGIGSETSGLSPTHHEIQTSEEASPSSEIHPDAPINRHECWTSEHGDVVPAVHPDPIEFTDFGFEDFPKHIKSGNLGSKDDSTSYVPNSILAAPFCLRWLPASFWGQSAEAQCQVDNQFSSVFTPPPDTPPLNATQNDEQGYNSKTLQPNSALNGHEDATKLSQTNSASGSSYAGSPQSGFSSEVRHTRDTLPLNPQTVRPIPIEHTGYLNGTMFWGGHATTLQSEPLYQAVKATGEKHAAGRVRQHSAPGLLQPIDLVASKTSDGSGFRSIAPNPITIKTNHARQFLSSSFESPLSMRRPALKIINQRDQDGGMVDLIRAPKGVRRGGLDEPARQNAKRVRLGKAICIRCRKDRKTCSGFPCSRCKDESLSKTWTQPCTKAHFLDIVISGTCNYISQRAVNHLTLDGTRRVRIDLPAIFYIENVLHLIDKRRDHFDIRVKQSNSSIYVLQLDKCYKYLSDIHRKFKKSQHDMRQFVDDTILSATKWGPCVRECDPTKDVLALMYVWNNMPSRASYYYVPKPQRYLQGNQPDRLMDVEDEEDRENIILAAQLSRIVCRMLEIDAYRQLQTTLNKFFSLKPEETIKFVRELGKILLTLRWRVSWWTVLGGGGAPDAGKRQFEDRVNSLCRVLYFYYCSMRSKIPSWCDKRDLDGIWSSYADTRSQIFDKFPEQDSIEGFEAWMRKGRELIEEAGVAHTLAGIGLASK